VVAFSDAKAWKAQEHKPANLRGSRAGGAHKFSSRAALQGKSGLDLSTVRAAAMAGVLESLGGLHHVYERAV